MQATLSPSLTHSFVASLVPILRQNSQDSPAHFMILLSLQLLLNHIPASLCSLSFKLGYFNNKRSPQIRLYWSWIDYIAIMYHNKWKCINYCSEPSIGRFPILEDIGLKKIWMIPISSIKCRSVTSSGTNVIILA